MLRFFNEIFDDASKQAFINKNSKPTFNSGDITQVVKKLGFKLNQDQKNNIRLLLVKFFLNKEFTLDDNMKASIKLAHDKYADSTSRVHLKNFQLDSYGRSFVKKYKLSPDSLMQSAFQIAYYKVYGKSVATYESASTSAFKLGRTETVRPATMATKKLAEIMAKKTNDSNVSGIYSLLKDCTKLHNQLVKEGAMGQGFDRHLFALKYHAEMRNKQSTPDFYKSYGYKFINHNTLSTSTLAYPNILTGGFAPVVADGFGIGYRILENSLGACVSSYSSKTELNVFVNELVETFERLHQLLGITKLKDD